jgi:hypothetical protein
VPRQNRVTPFGELIAVPDRGTLTGNRGVLHDAAGRVRRHHAGRRWIVCLLAFRGRWRAVMTPGRWTELFFLDEATALAAGHRPCAECQRERYNLFRGLWTSGGLPLADEMDAVLHAERLTPAGEKRTYRSEVARLPAGVMVADAADRAYLVRPGSVLRWTPAGYERCAPVSGPVRVLTPRSVVRAIRRGYPVGVHPSADISET